MSRALSKDDKLLSKQKQVAGEFKKSFVYDNAIQKVKWDKDRSGALSE